MSRGCYLRPDTTSTGIAVAGCSPNESSPLSQVEPETTVGLCNPEHSEDLGSLGMPNRVTRKSLSGPRFLAHVQSEPRNDGPVS